MPSHSSSAAWTTLHRPRPHILPLSHHEPTGPTPSHPFMKPSCIFLDSSCLQVILASRCRRLDLPGSPTRKKVVAIHLIQRCLARRAGDARRVRDLIEPRTGPVRAVAFNGLDEESTGGASVDQPHPIDMQIGQVKPVRPEVPKPDIRLKSNKRLRTVLESNHIRDVRFACLAGRARIDLNRQLPGGPNGIYSTPPLK